ncbi:hypothetical protein SBADM41S_04905 [Streptomyces badius]
MSLALLRLPRLDRDVVLSTSDGAVNGATYQLTLQDFGYQYEKGAVKDLQAGLEKTAQQIDTDIAKAK